jgi:hypothetical protein
MIRDMPVLDAEMAGRPHDDEAAQRATMAIAAISGCTSVNGGAKPGHCGGVKTSHWAMA